MALTLDQSAPTMFIRRAAFEQFGLARSSIDIALGLTPEEFRVEGDLIAIGPLVGESALTELIDALEAAGLTYFEDFFEMSGNWPEWLQLYAAMRG